jgi:hypothetical protein
MRPARRTAMSKDSVHIFIEIDGTRPPTKLEFDSPEVTGLQIKEKASVPPEDDLARRLGQRLELVVNDNVITIRNGEHFVALPPGTIS